MWFAKHQRGAGASPRCALSNHHHCPPAVSPVFPRILSLVWYRYLVDCDVLQCSDITWAVWIDPLGSNIAAPAFGAYTTTTTTISLVLAPIHILDCVYAVIFSHSLSDDSILSLPSAATPSSSLVRLALCLLLLQLPAISLLGT